MLRSNAGSGGSSSHTASANSRVDIPFSDISVPGGIPSLAEIRRLRVTISPESGAPTCGLTSAEAFPVALSSFSVD